MTCRVMEVVRCVQELTTDRYFCNPNFSSYIEALPGTYGTEEEKKYKGISSGDYLVQRLTATY
jgi:hypothetical protein